MKIKAEKQRPHAVKSAVRVLRVMFAHAKPAIATIGGIDGSVHRVVFPVNHPTPAYATMKARRTSRELVSRRLQSSPVLLSRFCRDSVAKTFRGRLRRNSIPTPARKNGSPTYIQGTIDNGLKS